MKKLKLKKNKKIKINNNEKIKSMLLKPNIVTLWQDISYTPLYPIYSHTTVSHNCISTVL